VFGPALPDVCAASITRVSMCSSTCSCTPNEANPELGSGGRELVPGGVGTAAVGSEGLCGVLPALGLNVTVRAHPSLPSLGSGVRRAMWLGVPPRFMSAISLEPASNRSTGRESQVHSSSSYPPLYLLRRLSPTPCCRHRDVVRARRLGGTRRGVFLGEVDGEGELSP
jgi:hypothetical protein